MRIYKVRACSLTPQPPQNKTIFHQGVAKADREREDRKVLEGRKSRTNPQEHLLLRGGMFPTCWDRKHKILFTRLGEAEVTEGRVFCQVVLLMTSATASLQENSDPD